MSITAPRSAVARLPLGMAFVRWVEGERSRILNRPLTLSELACVLNVTRPYLYQLRNGKKDAGVRTITEYAGILIAHFQYPQAVIVSDPESGATWIQPCGAA